MTIGIDARLYFESGVGRYIKNTLLELDYYTAKNKTSDKYFIFLSNKGFEKISFESDALIKVKADVPWHSLKEQVNFTRILNSYNLDLMHFTYFSLPIFYRRKFVVTIHDLIINYVNTGKATTLPKPIYYLKRAAYHKVIEHAVKKSAHIIAPSHATKNEILKNYKVNKEKISVIAEGIDPDLFKKSTKPNALVPGKYILYVGNAYPHKNLNSLINAYRMIEDEVDEDLVLVGKDDYFYKKIHNQIEGDTRIHIFNSINDYELSYLYKNASFLISPSLMEGFGLTPLEAMANNCLPVVSSIDAFKEVCENAALYFNPESLKDIAGVLKKAILINKNEKERYEKLFKDRIKKFSWEKSLLDTLKIYERCNSIR